MLMPRRGASNTMVPLTPKENETEVLDSLVIPVIVSVKGDVI